MARAVLLAVTGLTIGAGLATAALALSRAGGPQSPSSFSPTGTPVDPATLSASERATLEQAGVASVRFIREAAGVRFYTGRSRADSAMCLITGINLSAQPHFGVLACPSSDFPSTELPIWDYSPRRAALTDRYPHLQYLAGFAADGIASVGARDEQGDVHWSDVVDNTYASRDIPAGAATEILARGQSGDVVYSDELGGKTLASRFNGSQ
jgi:hypothetical protein